MTTAIIGSPTRTNVLLADAWRALGVNACILWPLESLRELEPGDVALMRIDVLPTLDGVEPGLEVGAELEQRGVRVLNRTSALLATHDKLRTVERLGAAGVPHPRTRWLEPSGIVENTLLPCVVKPRFGSWGQDVFACHTLAELGGTLKAVAGRSWFQRHGALLQELVGPVRRDLRLVVAGRSVVAAAERTAAPGEWRTNVSLGGRVVPTTPPDDALELAIRAAAAIGMDLVGVDLLPTAEGWLVLELNGAVDFDSRYALPDVDPYAAILEALGLESEPPRREHTIRISRKETPMTKTVRGDPARPGDEIVITGHAVGDAPKTALILEVLGEPGHERYHVRWEDGHESVFFPAEDAIVRRPKKRRASTA